MQAPLNVAPDDCHPEIAELTTELATRQRPRATRVTPPLSRDSGAGRQCRPTIAIHGCDRRLPLEVGTIELATPRSCGSPAPGERFATVAIARGCPAADPRNH